MAGIGRVVAHSVMALAGRGISDDPDAVHRKAVRTVLIIILMRRYPEQKRPLRPLRSSPVVDWSAAALPSPCVTRSINLPRSQRSILQMRVRIDTSARTLTARDTRYNPCAGG